MSLPWDNPPPIPPTPRPQQPPFAPLIRAQDMHPDIPVVARNTQTGETVKLDIGSVLQQAVKDAIAANKDNLQASGQRALTKTLKGEKTVIEHRKVVSGDGAIDEIEDTFEAGPVTTRTFMQGMAVDVGFAVMTVAATTLTPGFNAFDKEAWTITGVLILKTVLTTGMSYAMSLQVK